MMALTQDDLLLILGYEIAQRSAEILMLRKRIAQLEAMAQPTTNGTAMPDAPDPTLLRS